MSRNERLAWRIVIFALKLCCVAFAFFAVWMAAALVMPGTDASWWYPLAVIFLIWSGLRIGDTAIYAEEEFERRED